VDAVVNLFFHTARDGHEAIPKLGLGRCDAKIVGSRTDRRHLFSAAEQRNEAVVHLAGVEHQAVAGLQLGRDGTWAVLEGSEASGNRKEAIDGRGNEEGTLKVSYPEEL
jgi:hypothetical protein